ncbi:MBL fold metallo-hydrolase [Aurantiacibacter poecillastricola]|uniref:MBL fold metallo-hydrolase n=1 Tax=Aurantiacibacter poecillastricola TaxID=3064385 RepID=UPI00273E3C52|nr:MBL fold metallo-hydrolase [Aurantiacibacter sp. 219JJ12-13]MDP5261398.1 MBL fold metallo-hydrolase [Aurantiacibacter sp. 219JJ12-13]
MQRVAILSAILLGGVAVTGAVAQGIPGIENIEQVGENLYRIPGAGGNTIVFVRSDDVVLVDTKVAGQGEALMEQVRSVTDKPIAMVINTHSHPDHVGSNAFFRENHAVQVVAQANTAARMQAEGGQFPANPVDTEFTTYRQIGEGEDRIELYWFGAGHTDGDAFVMFPENKTMVAGDIYAWHMSPLIDPGSGGSMLALPTTVTAAYYNIPEAETVISGHGGVHTREEFLSWVTFNRGLVQIAEETAQRGGTPEEALARLEAVPSWAVFMGDEPLPGLEYGGTPRGRAYINLMVAFEELMGEEPQLRMGIATSEIPARQN